MVAELKDLKEMTVRALQELARTVVGPGYSKLRTRADLIRGITEAMERRAAARKAEASSESASDPSAWQKGKGSPARAAEPRPEGHLVARIRGEAEAHAAPHALTEDRLDEAAAPEAEAEEPAPTTVEPQVAEPMPAAHPEPPVDDEGLGELPWSYEDDAVVALARDPYTLWVYWDYAHQTVQDAMRGLENPYVRMHVYEQGRLVREIDVALESRSFYVNDLVPGRHYRVEFFFYGSRGEQHRIGRPSNTIGLPPRGPSPIIDDRFVTIPWGMPLARRGDLFARAQQELGFSGEERDRLHAASAGQPLGASESLAPGVAGPSGVAGGGRGSARPWSGTRYEGA